MDTILEEDENEHIYRGICPHANHGFDKSGNPIYLEGTGNIDLPKLLKYLTPDLLVRRHIRQQVNIAPLRARLGRGPIV